MLDLFGKKTPIFWVQTSIYVHENAIAAIKIGVLFLRKNQAFNPVHPQIKQNKFISLPRLETTSKLSLVQAHVARLGGISYFRIDLTSRT